MHGTKEENALAGLEDANRDRADFSGHGGAKGAAGFIDPADQSANIDFLGRRGDVLAVTPPATGFDEIRLAAAWDHAEHADTSFMGKLLKRKVAVDIDLDLGVLYEMKDGSRGAVQAFGKLMGRYDAPPYIALSGDERTGRADGEDEYIRINGKAWPDIKRILTYIYIYRGVPDWAGARPQIQLRVPNQNPLVVTLASHHKTNAICAVAGLENVRDGIRLTNYTEYFPGHAEMDRAFGFGLEWETGRKA
jgi:tellurite resistance protein TerA